MPGIAQRNAQFGNAPLSSVGSVSASGIWSRNRGGNVTFDQLQKVDFLVLVLLMHVKTRNLMSSFSSCELRWIDWIFVHVGLSSMFRVCVLVWIWFKFAKFWILAVLD